MRKLLVVCTMFAAACSCGKKDTGGADAGPPTVDVAPGSLPPGGMIVEQPADGDTLHGAWVSVTGWVDHKRFQSVYVVGAPVRGYYAMSPGHFAVPSVPVLVRSDGRFVAPRVPLQDGAVEIAIIPMGSGDTQAPPETVTLHVTATDTSAVPATAVARVSSSSAPATATLQAFAASGTPTWEWDFDGDAVQDAAAAQGDAVTHLYADGGTAPVTARSKDTGGRWVYAVTAVTLAEPSQVLDSAPATQPRALAVVTDYAAWQAGLDDDGLADGGSDETALTRAVVMSDGDTVQVFDAHLNLKQTLTGLTQPTGVAGDAAGRFYVADTGANRVVRFNGDGTLDTTFGDGGTLRDVSDGTTLLSPAGLALGYSGDFEDGAQAELLVRDEFGSRLLRCTGDPMTCAPLQPAVLMNDAVVPQPPSGDGALSSGVSLRDIHFTGAEGAFPSMFSDSQSLYAWSPTNGGVTYNVVATPGTALLALSQVTARGVMGMNLVFGAASDGALRVWLVGDALEPESRREKLPYSVTAIAFDPYATAVKWRAWRDTNVRPHGAASGPSVAYVAGAGKLERRLFSSVEVLPW